MKSNQVICSHIFQISFAAMWLWSKGLYNTVLSTRNDGNESFFLKTLTNLFFVSSKERVKAERKKKEGKTLLLH